MSGQLILAAVAVLASLTAAVDPLLLYVSPSGSDTHTGASPQQALQSCAGAVNRVQQLVSWPAGGVEVQFSEGVFPLTAATACGTLSTHAAEGAPLVLRGAPSSAASGASTVFDGSESLETTDLKPVSDSQIMALLNPAASSSILVMPIPNGTWTGGQLYWNGVPLSASVWPDRGLGYVKRVNDVGAVWCGGRTRGPRPHCTVCRGDQKSTAAVYILSPCLLPPCLCLLSISAICCVRGRLPPFAMYKL